MLTMVIDNEDETRLLIKLQYNITKLKRPAYTIIVGHCHVCVHLRQQVQVSEWLPPV